MEKLILQCIAGDKEASRQFIEQHTPLVRSAIIHVIKTYSSPIRYDFDDLHNGLFLHLMEDDWRRLRMFKGNSKISTYIRVITVRYVISYLRKQKKPHLSFDSNNVARKLEAQNNLHNENELPKEYIKILKYCIEELKTQEQLLLKLLYFKELPPRQIFRIMNISGTAFYNRKGRAIKKLEKCARKRGLQRLYN